MLNLGGMHVIARALDFKEILTNSLQLFFISE